MKPPVLTPVGHVPENLFVGLRNYVFHQQKTGGFLRAVLENDLQNAVARGDVFSLTALPDLVAFAEAHLPGSCWGDRERVKQWLEGKPQPARLCKFMELPDDFEHLNTED